MSHTQRVYSLALTLSTTLFMFMSISNAAQFDWHGTVGADTEIFNGYRLTRGKINTPSALLNDGSQEILLDKSGRTDVAWQSYILKLNPSMVINDSASLFMELSTGTYYGGFFGDAPYNYANQNNSQGMLYSNQSKGVGLLVTKAYLELYSDTATYQIGRHSFDWGLGGIYSSGANSWDRTSTARDGVTMKLKIGNFSFMPFWNKVANSSQFTDLYYVKEAGISAIYDNPEKDISLGILYANKTGGGEQSIYTATGSNTSLGSIDVKITDFYLKKVFGKLEASAEIPMLSGSASSNMTFNSKAFLINANYFSSENWTFNLQFIHASGQDGDTASYKAFYLNPNYKIANILFHYDMNTVAKTNVPKSIYDSSVVNTQAIKLAALYKTEKWQFDSALIFADALEVGQTGKAAYNHQIYKNYTAQTNQNKHLGTEFDFNANYHWNKELTVGSSLGYLFTGEYYAYSNNPQVTLQTQNALFLQLNTSITF